MVTLVGKALETVIPAQFHAGENVAVTPAAGTFDKDRLLAGLYVGTKLLGQVLYDILLKVAETVIAA